MDAKQVDPEGGDADLKHKVMEQLDRLDAPDQRKVLDFSRALAARRQSTGPGGAYLAFAGLIPKQDLAEMERAIEEGCEKVDEEAW